MRHATKLHKRSVTVARIFRCDAIGWNPQLELAHVCVMGANGNARIRRSSRQNEPLAAEFVEQEVESGAIERRTTRLQQRAVASLG